MATKLFPITHINLLKLQEQYLVQKAEKAFAEGRAISEEDVKSRDWSNENEASGGGSDLEKELPDKKKGNGKAKDKDDVKFNVATDSILLRSKTGSKQPLKGT